jgi:hypothetical protein
MFLPLDPEKMIVLFDPVAYRVGPDHRNVVEVTSPQDMYALNTLQACAASDNIYFRGDALDTAALHRKAAPFLRDEKTRFHIFQKPSTDPQRREEIIASSRADVRTNLSLSFLTLRKYAKRWRDATRQPRAQRGAEVRNQHLVDSYMRFREEVKRGKYRPSEFLRFAAEHGGSDPAARHTEVDDDSRS